MIYYTDGFMMGSNPSPIGGGYTICTEGRTDFWQEKVLKEGLTNNEAELLGVLHAAMLASKGDTIFTDSQNTIAWVKSGKPKARPDLTDKALLAKRLIIHKNLVVGWVPRESNLAGLINEGK